MTSEQQPLVNNGHYFGVPRVNGKYLGLTVQGVQLFCDKVFEIKLKSDDEFGKTKLSSIAWRHLWIAP